MRVLESQLVLAKRLWERSDLSTRIVIPQELMSGKLKKKLKKSDQLKGKEPLNISLATIVNQDIDKIKFKLFLVQLIINEKHKKRHLLNLEQQRQQQAKVFLENLVKN